MQFSRVRLLVAAAVLAPALAGCAVPQKRGEGKYAHVKEPTTGARYHLYLPVEYVKNNGRHPNPKMKRWPLVMTFHGMKPYDNALPQEREWERQADIYGYIVCAPELETSDSFMEYPLTREHNYVLRDKRNVIAIMDHVFNTTLADPNKVLSTSWSCGGYLAHYFPNRFPDRFSCIATRLSNFSARLLLEETVPKYRNRVPVAIFIGDGDFPACKTESEEAVAWYTARGFRVIRGKMIDDIGHARIPQTAAAFFAEQIGVEPFKPVEAAETVAKVQMTEYYPPVEMIARVAPPVGYDYGRTALASNQRRSSPTVDTTPAVAPRTTRREIPESSYAVSTAGRRYPFDRSPSYDPSPNQNEAAARTQREPTPSPTRITAADRNPNANLLNPPVDRRGDSPGATRKPPEPAPRQPTQIARPEPRRSPPAAKPPAEKPRVNPPPGDTRVASAERARRSAAPPVVRNRSFTPSDVGTRQYGPITGETGAAPVNGPASAANFTLASNRADVAPASRRWDQADAVRTRPADSHNEPAPSVPRPHPKRVEIRLNGPSIGSAPHYLAYSVSLPRDITAGADFLWMDNGVWIGNEPRGVKILESPGLHRISVLIVTRSNIEYRGAATVQVLERGPTASAY